MWIGGNGTKDHQILKFTKDGTFVMQIGKAGRSKGNADTPNLNQPADAFVHAATNELFVADGTAIAASSFSTRTREVQADVGRVRKDAD